ncbi:MAG: YeeE/YedE family protein [Candidatus Heimdallarchaeota archaeon]
MTPLDFLSAMILGIAIGLVLQRGRVCSNTAFRNLLLIRNPEVALVLVIAVMVELIGYQLLQLLSITEILPGFNIRSNPIMFSSILIPIGSLLFGFGTVFAGGCAGGVCYRVGEGSIKSLLAFLGFGIGIAIFALEPFNSAFVEVQNATLWTIQGQTPSFEQILPRPIWTIGAVSMLGVLVYKYRRTPPKLPHFREGWSPLMSGLVLGVLGTLARLFSTLAGRPFGLSTTDGIGELFSVVSGILGITSPLLGWAGIMILGLIIGASLSSLQINEFKIKTPNTRDLIRFFGGGLLLGIGAMLASGCNFGHILGGIPELGISSVIALIFMMFGNWIASYLMYNVLGEETPVSTPLIL